MPTRPEGLRCRTRASLVEDSDVAEIAEDVRERLIEVRDAVSCRVIVEQLGQRSDRRTVRTRARKKLSRLLKFR